MISLDAFGNVLVFQNTRGLEQSLKLGQATCSWVPLSIGPTRTRGCVEVEVMPNENSLEVCVGAPNRAWNQVCLGDLRL